MIDFKVSIIIPVYNASFFLEKAVMSALRQSQTGEIILIEDGSTDDSYLVCKMLELKYDIVKLISHPENKNKGAGASRNLGIVTAVFPYISFLDADDYYLPNRFNKTESVFSSDLSIDGVYEACGFKFYTEESKKYEMLNNNLTTRSIENHLYTITKKIPAEALFYHLLKGDCGFFQTNGITFRKAIVEKTGLMNTKLKLHQDTDFFMKLSALGKLMPGETIKPIAMIGRHENNRITAVKKNDNYYLSILYKELFLFSLKNIEKIDKRGARLTLKFYALHYKNGFNSETVRFLKILYFLKNLTVILFRYPKTLKFI